MVRAHPAFKELSVDLKCGCWIPEAKLLAAGMLLAGREGQVFTSRQAWGRCSAHHHPL